MPAARQHFCYLIANDLGTVKTHTYIGCSRWPYQRLRAHNRELPGGPKNTKAAGESGAWRLRLIIGPFKADAKRFKLQWVRIVRAPRAHRCTRSRPKNE